MVGNIKILYLENYFEEYSCICRQIGKTYIDAIHLISIIQNPIVVNISVACCGDDTFQKIVPHLEGCKACFKFDNLAFFINKYKTAFLENSIKIGTSYVNNCSLTIIDNNRVMCLYDEEYQLQHDIGATFCKKYLNCLNFISHWIFKLLQDIFNDNHIEQLKTCVEVSEQIVNIFPDEFQPTIDPIVDSQFGLVKYFCTLTSFIFLMLPFGFEQKYVLQILPPNNLLVCTYSGRRQTQIHYFEDIYIYENANFLISQSKKNVASTNLVEEIFYKLVPGCSFIVEKLITEKEAYSFPIVSTNWMSRLVEYSSSNKRLLKLMCCSLLLMFEYIIANRFQNSPLFTQIYETAQTIDYISNINKLFLDGNLADWLADKPQNLVQFHIHWFQGQREEEIFGKHLLSKVSPNFPTQSVLARLIQESTHFSHLQSLLCSMRDRTTRQALTEEFVSLYLIGRPEIETVITSHLPFYALFKARQFTSTEAEDIEFGVFGKMPVIGGAIGKEICLILVKSMFSDTINLIQKRCKYKNKF
jgi:hypothetical protein